MLETGIGCIVDGSECAQTLRREIWKYVVKLKMHIFKDSGNVSMKHEEEKYLHICIRR